MQKPPIFSWDKNLREIPDDIDHLKSHIQNLRIKLKDAEASIDKVKIMGEIGYYLRTLNELADAESILRDALDLISSQNLGVRLMVQQKMRRAHVLQWKKEFSESTALFDEIIQTCSENPEADYYLPFALQHAGKNLFDQDRLTEALTLFEEALKLRKSRNAPEDQVESTLSAITATKNAIKLRS